MSLIMNGTEVKEITFNGAKVDKLNYGGVEVYSSFPIPPGKPLNDYTWSEIQQITQAGLAPEYFNVGDRKKVTLNGTVSGRTLSNYKWYCYILGFNHNAATEGNNTIHFQFGYSALSGGVHTALTQSYDSVWEGFRMEKSNTNVGGWNSSLMRTYTIPEFKNCLPSDLKSVLKAVTKYTDNTGNASNKVADVTATLDEIFLLAEYEVFGSWMGANKYEHADSKQVQYDFYKSGNSKIMYNDQSPGTSVDWWGRSPNGSYSTIFCYVNKDGVSGGNAGNRSRGFAPGFCVG